MAIFCTGVRPSFHFLYYILTIVHLICRNRVLSADNIPFLISKLCIQRFNPLSKQIDGAVITSKREENLNCVLTFHTETVLQRFMLRFESLALDCNDHLYIFDGDLPVGTHKVRLTHHYFAAHLSCRSTRSEVGLIFTQGNFVTLKYMTDNWSKPDDGFQLVITAFKDSPSVGCGVLKCLNSFCISRDLACDGINHCGDNSDETSHALCYPPPPENDLIFGLQVKLFVAVVLLIIIVCLVCVVTLAINLCKREQQLQRQRQQRIAMQMTTPILAHPASYTGTTGATLSPGSQRFATLPFEKIREKPPPYPGNMYTPAVGNNTTSNHIIGNAAVQQVVYYATK
ncbi:hypothetical protein B4U80_01657 [Leptotrombidium deliense]|uniref:CUB domain-containing protein n=1 Tax=Leptotrombidium deliense TaxID=299467 RepID=A0A443SMG5_9ACAR|nr:hypothetical protein B4U80_01657 [Leptotrombidium deliense]